MLRFARRGERQQRLGPLPLPNSRGWKLRGRRFGRRKRRFEPPLPLSLTHGQNFGQRRDDPGDTGSTQL